MTPTRALRSPRPALALALLLAAAAPAAVRADYDELAEFKANGAEPYLDFGSSLYFGRGCAGASASPTVCLSVWMCACARTCVCRRRPVSVRMNM